MNCPAPNCKASVLPGKLMCVAHWRAVPFTVQYAVYRSYAAMKQAKVPERRVELVKRYREARDRAVKAVCA